MGLKIGIICDNYKVAKFKQELEKEKLVICNEKPFAKDKTLLTLLCEKFQVDKIRNICILLENKYQ